MQDYEARSLIDNCIRSYRNFTLPVIVFSEQYDICTGNIAARSFYPTLCTPVGLAALLSEFPAAQLRERLESEGSLALVGSFPFSDMSISLVSIGRQVDGIMLMLFKSDAPPRADEAYLASKSTAAFGQTVRYSVSHIFDSLDTVSLKADLLQTGWIKPSFNNISAYSYRILRAAENMATYSSYLQGALELRFRTINIVEALHEISGPVTAIGRSMDISVRFDLPQEPCPIMADRRLIELALFNLIHNSLFYTRYGNHIEVALNRSEGNVHLAVSDSGIGIPPELLPDIWRPYVTCDHDRRGSGMGLGLAIVKLAAETHSASCAIRSAPKEGTTVTLRLPLAHYVDRFTLGRDDGDLSSYFMNRFSPLYTGLADAVESPYREYDNP